MDIKKLSIQTKYMKTCIKLHVIIYNFKPLSNIHYFWLLYCYGTNFENAKVELQRGKKRECWNRDRYN